MAKPRCFNRKCQETPPRSRVSLAPAPWSEAPASSQPRGWFVSWNIPQQRGMITGGSPIYGNLSHYYTLLETISGISKKKKRSTKHYFRCCWLMNGIDGWLTTVSANQPTRLCVPLCVLLTIIAPVKGSEFYWWVFIDQRSWEKTQATMIICGLHVR